MSGDPGTDLNIVKKGYRASMHAVISLLDETRSQALKELWSELARHCGVHALSTLVPFPHFSYQIAHHYNEKQILTRLEAIARHTPPFQVMTGGLNLFTGSHPVLSIPLVRTMALSLLHQTIWQEISPLGGNVSLYYNEERWCPHITLAEHDLEKQSLSQIVSLLSERDFSWSMTINNLAVIWDTGTGQEVRYHFDLQQQ
jgi:2'-5' RNA ligase